MGEPDGSRVIRFEDAQGRIPGPPGQHFVSLMQRGTLRVSCPFPYPQTARRRTCRTRSTSSSAAEASSFTVASGIRSEPATFSSCPQALSIGFEDFTEDLAVWVIFYGPNGGEVRA